MIAEPVKAVPTLDESDAVGLPSFLIAIGSNRLSGLHSFPVWDGQPRQPGHPLMSEKGRHY